MSASPGEILATRREAIERSVLARIASLPTSQIAASEPIYAEGTRAAVGAVLGYAIDALQARTGARPAPVPVEILAQARRAAALGVPLDAVLRRYLAGYAVLEEEMLLAAPIDDPAAVGRLRQALIAEAAILDHVIAEVSAEYRTEQASRAHAVDRQRAAWVRGLLSGHHVDRRRLNYDLDGWHLGVIACGAEAEAHLRTLAADHDRRLLLVHAESGIVWAWLGSAKEPESLGSAALGPGADASGLRATVGECGKGIDGWRATHRQALAAFALLMRSQRTSLRYRDVAVLTAVAADELLVDWLFDTVLEPLGRDDGPDLLGTLRSYFEASRNASCAAASLGVSRHTVTKRLRLVEERLGQPIEAIAPRLELALDLHRILRA